MPMNWQQLSPLYRQTAYFRKRKLKRNETPTEYNFQAAHVIAKARQFADSEMTKPRIT